MRLVQNSGSDRVLDQLCGALGPNQQLDVATSALSLFAFGDTTCAFRDSAFTDDVAKTNLSAILEQHGIANVRSL